MLESEVSSKTTLRNLQYRQNRLKEEKKEKHLRAELETQKEKEKKEAQQAQVVAKKKELEKRSLVHENKLDMSIGEEDTAIVEDEKQIKHNIEV